MKTQLPNQCKCTTVMKSAKEVIHQVICIWYLTRAPGQWCLKRFERYISTAKWLVLKSLCYHDGWQMYRDCDWVSYHLYVQHNICDKKWKKSSLLLLSHSEKTTEESLISKVRPQVNDTCQDLIFVGKTFDDAWLWMF